jgi:hypothetical protein
MHTILGMSIPLDIDYTPAGCIWNLEVNSSRKVALTAISFEYSISVAAPSDSPGIPLLSASNLWATGVGSLQVWGITASKIIGRFHLSAQ